MINFPKAVYTMTFKQFIAMTGSWFADNIVFPEGSVNVSNEELQDEIIARWKWYEISGETIDQQKEFLLDVLTEWRDYYIDRLNAYESIRNLDIQQVAGKKTRTIDDERSSNFTNTGSNTGTQSSSISNTVANTGTQESAGLAADNESVDTHVELPNKQISPTDYFAYPNDLRKNATSHKSTRTDNLNEQTTGSNTRTDNLAHTDTNTGNTSRDATETETDGSQMIIDLDKYFKIVRPILHEFADKFTDCFIHLYD